MIVPVMAISNLVLTQQIYSEETNGAHAHYREPVPLKKHGHLLHKCLRLLNALDGSNHKYAEPIINVIKISSIGI